MAALFLLLLPALALAQEGQALPYADALRLALTQNPSLKVAHAELAAAEGQVISARGAFDPALAVSGSDTFAKDQSSMVYGQVQSRTSALEGAVELSTYVPTGTSLALQWDASRSNWYYKLQDGESALAEDEERYFDTTLSASVSQSLLRGFGTAWNLQQIRSARRAVSRQEAAVEEARLQVVADVAAAYWALRTAQDLEDICRQAVAVAEEESRVVQALVDQGKLAQVERSRVAVAVAQAQSALLEASAGRAAASDSLAVLVGERPGALYVAVTAPDPPARILLDEQKVVEVALTSNPTLLAWQVEQESADDALSMARRGRLPDLVATGSYALGGHEDTWGATLSQVAGLDLPQWYVGADLTVPLGNRERRGQVIQAAGAADAARLSVELARLTLEQQVRAQVRRVNDGAQHLELAEATVRNAEDTLNAEKALQREGRAIQKDVLEAQRAWAQARADRVKAQADHAQAIVDLGRLQGRIEGVGR